MWLYAFAVTFLLAAIISLVICFVNYKKSNKPDISDEDKAKAVKKYKNAFFFFVIFAVVCEVFILVAKKFSVL